MGQYRSPWADTGQNSPLKLKFGSFNPAVCFLIREGSLLILVLFCFVFHRGSVAHTDEN